MSISSPQTGGSRRPSSRPAAGAKPAGNSTAKAASTKSGTGATGSKTAGARTSGGAKGAGPRTTPPKAAGGGKGGGRPPITPVKVEQPRPWSAIALFTVVALVAVGIVGFGLYEAFKPGYDWRKDAQSIPGVVEYTKTEPAYLKSAQHQWGPITYKQSPPVGGPHNPNWQRCQGDVYPAQIANEHAVHAMEHGAVWITYRPDLPQAQIDKLAAKVKGNDFMLMSPYPGLDKPISLQAWGFQLKLDKPNADDPRIDRFIHALRQNDTQEGMGVVCSSGNYISVTGTTPHDLGKPTTASS